MNDAEAAIENKLDDLKASGKDLNRVAFSYARVSSEKQEKGNSREDQVMHASVPFIFFCR